MKIIRSIKQMYRVSKKIGLNRQTIGFVPTMGALHEGHASLIRQARSENDIVVVSIFVNPIQFGPKEDFRRYPRPKKEDITLCRKAGVDFIFYPEAKQMYQQGFKTYVTVEELSDVLCGKFRSGHFRGVATVVTKLFNIIKPHTAYFGGKDAQQAIIISRMVLDLNIPLKIKVMPTVRDKDGLALSSRNIYLNQKEREDATVLYQALNLAGNLIKQGRRAPSDIMRKMKRLIHQKKSAKIQYISIVDSKDLKPAARLKGKVLIALAVWMGKTRLIDNAIISC